MSQQLKVVEKETRTARRDLEALVKSREWEIARAAVDAAGIVDPTPASDALGMGMSIASGDWIGAGLSAVSMVPYLGDALGKTAKGARAAKRLQELAAKIAKLTKKLDHLGDPMRRRIEAARRVRAARREAIGSVQECARKGEWGKGVRVPKTGGRWEPPDSIGHGRWVSDDGFTVQFRHGYPNFSTATGPAGPPMTKGRVQIEQIGDHYEDYKAADAKMRQIYGKEWKRPEGYTWHHGEDSATMTLVRSDLHSGVPHTGGANMSRSEDF